MDVFLHTVIIIDTVANLGVNAKIAVWRRKKQKETERKDYWQQRSLEKNDPSDGQRLKQAPNPTINHFQQDRHVCAI